MEREEYSDALYYFNKADFEERGNIASPPGIIKLSSECRQARHGISAIRRQLKAWAYDFEGAEIALGQVKNDAG
jgi:hypothetical protein